VGEAVGDGDGVECGGVERDLGMLGGVVCEVDTTMGMTGDPFVLFSSDAFVFGLDSV
jgi:hypothetical protein